MGSKDRRKPKYRQCNGLLGMLTAARIAEERDAIDNHDHQLRLLTRLVTLLHQRIRELERGPDAR